MEKQKEIRAGQYDHRDTYKIRFLIGAAALIVFFLMHYLYTSGISEEFDLTVGEAVRSIRAPGLNEVLIGITHLANWKTLVGIGVTLLVINAVRWRKPDYPVAFAFCLITLAIYKLLKEIVQRPRPDAIFWLVKEHGYSFPSGHSLNGMFCYGMMIYLLWRNCPNKLVRNILTVIICLAIPLIAYSRVYCGVHHPTDVMAGLAAGLALLMPGTVLMDEILLDHESRKAAKAEAETAEKAEPETAENN